MAVKGAGRTIRWPEPTHGPLGSGLLPYRTAREIIDWRDIGVPVEEKVKKGKIRSPHTLERIHIGLEKFGGEPFIIQRRQHDNPPESDVRSVDQPLHTITANATDIILITPRGRRKIPHHRCLKVVELLRAMSLPDNYQLHGTKKDKVRQIGNAVPVRTVREHIKALMDS